MKVLDFGLAKAAAGDAVDSELAQVADARSAVHTTASFSARRPT